MGCTARPLTFPLPDNVDPLPVFLDWRLAWSIDRTLPIRSLMRPLFFLPWAICGCGTRERGAMLR